MCSIMLSFRLACEINKGNTKSAQKQQTFCKTCCKLIKTRIYKIAVNSAKFCNPKNWVVSVNS